MLDEEASAIVISSDDSGGSFDTPPKSVGCWVGSLQESLYELLVQLMLTKDSPLFPPPYTHTHTHTHTHIPYHR